MRALRLTFCALVLAAIAPAGAAAKVIEIGDAAPISYPSCPSSCTVLTRTTAYEARVGTSKTVDQVSRPGSIVAWTLALGKPGKKQTSFFVNTIKLGSAPQARLTVLKPVGKQKLHYVVAAQSPLVDLSPYIGFTVQLPLATSIQVHTHELIAVSTPTWAPILAETGHGDVAWRNPRPKNACRPPTLPPPDSSLASGATGVFACLFDKERLTFSATMITKPGTPVITTPTQPSTTTTTTTTTTTPTDTTPTSTSTSTKPKTG